MTTQEKIDRERHQEELEEYFGNNPIIENFAKNLPLTTKDQENFYIRRLPISFYWTTEQSSKGVLPVRIFAQAGSNQVDYTAIINSFLDLRRVELALFPYIGPFRKSAENKLGVGEFNVHYCVPIEHKTIERLVRGIVQSKEAIRKHRDMSEREMLEEALDLPWSTPIYVGDKK